MVEATGGFQIRVSWVNLSSGLNLYLRLNNTTPAGSFLKGCTWVYRTSKLFWNKQKQTCRQLESKKQNNMHYSWPDCIQKLFGGNWQPDTHSSVSNSNSWQKLRISRWGSGLAWYVYASVCSCMCISVCSCAAIYSRCVHVSASCN